MLNERPGRTLADGPRRGSELKWIAEGDSGAGLPAPLVSRHRFHERVAWVVAAVFALACLALAIGFLRRAQEPARVLRSSLLPPPGSSFLPYNFAIAPDGSRLGFVALGPDGKTALWVRGLSSSNAQQLTGTEGATFPSGHPIASMLPSLRKGDSKPSIL